MKILKTTICFLYRGGKKVFHILLNVYIFSITHAHVLKFNLCAQSPPRKTYDAFERKKPYQKEIKRRNAVDSTLLISLLGSFEK